MCDFKYLAGPKKYLLANILNSHKALSLSLSLSLSLLSLSPSLPLSLQPPADVVAGQNTEGQESKEHEEEEQIPCTPEPKEWICLGSDKEIKEGTITDSRPLVMPCIAYIMCT